MHSCKGPPTLSILTMGKMGKYLSVTYDGNDKLREQCKLENMEGWWVEGWVETRERGVKVINSIYLKGIGTRLLSNMIHCTTTLLSSLECVLLLLRYCYCAIAIFRKRYTATSLLSS